LKRVISILPKYVPYEEWSKVKTHAMYKVRNHKLEQVKESKGKQALDWMKEK
jgi:hypothetical protein